jgi:hypothetical protein
MALIVPPELAIAFFPTQARDSATVAVLETAIGMATLLAGIGLTITGRAVLKAGRWFGWQRYVPLLCGVFVSPSSSRSSAPSLIYSCGRSPRGAPASFCSA